MDADDAVYDALSRSVHVTALQGRARAEPARHSAGLCDRRVATSDSGVVSTGTARAWCALVGRRRGMYEGGPSPDQDVQDVESSGSRPSRAGGAAAGVRISVQCIDTA